MARVILSLFLMSIAVTSFAQNTFDKVLMLSGEVKEGNVTGISELTIQFIHKGESLKYELKKADISKIEFGSGRIEVFNEMPESNSDNSLADHHNKIAVLPFIYIRDGEQKKNDAIERKVQQEFVTLMQNHIGVLKIQPTNTTNALLAKNGVNDENYIQYTMPELANMLGVEYVVQSTLEISKKGATSYNSSSLFLKENNAKDKVSGSSFSSSSTQIEYQTNMSMVLYNDQGESVWSRSKEAFWPNEDAYKETLKFMLKRMPIYTK